MAFYSLIAQDQRTHRWRTCAIFQAGSIQSAAIQAKSLRESNALGFVPAPAQFKMRGTSRRELFLLTSYLNSVDNTHIETFRQEELQSFLRRRRKLMMSFFLGLFHDPEGMKRRSTGGSGGKPNTIKNTTSGGIEVESESSTHDEATEVKNTPSNDQAIEQNSADTIATTSSEVSSTTESREGALTDASEQEAALAALLSSDEANPSSNDNSGEIDLDFI